MAGRVTSTSPTRGWPVIGIAWLVGLVMGVVLASFAPWNGGGGLLAPPATPTATATPTVPTATPSLTATPTDSPSPTDSPTLTPTATPTPSPTLSPSPTPRVTPPPAGSVFGLAWFHKPPEDGTTAEQLADTHRYVHLTGPSDLEFRDALRAAGYTGPIYDYVTAYTVEGPGPYKNNSATCEAGYLPYEDTMAWFKDDFCTYIHPHESWFLHNSKGERLVDDYFGSGHWNYFMNPANPDWQAFSYQRVRYARGTWGYDGVWLDNLDLDLSRLVTDLHNSDGKVREYATDAAWQTATKGWLEGLRGAVGPWAIWANILGKDTSATAWDPYAPYLDGAMQESFSVRWLDEWLPPAAWEAQMERAERWLGAGKGLVMVGQGHKTDTDRLLFTLASYLLVAQGDQAFYRYTRFDSYYNSVWLYPEYDTARALGAPRGPRQEIRPGVWQRLFDHGSVEVNVAQHTGRLLLDQP